MKIKHKRNLRVLKITGFILLFGFCIYLLLLIFVPNQLQRLGSGLRSAFGPGKPQGISMATAGEGGHYYRLGTLIKQEMEKQRNRTVDVLLTQGSLDNIERVRDGRADFALIQGALPEGETVSFEGLAAVTGIGRQYVHILVPNNSPIRTFKDLAGKKVGMGPYKSGNAALGKLVFAYFPPSTAVQPVYGDIYNIEENFRIEKMEAFFTVYDLHAPVLEKLMNTGAYRLVPIPEAEAVAYTIPGCFAGVIPHSVYGPHRNIPSPTGGRFETLQVKTLLITRKEMSGYVVRDLVRVIYSRRFIKQSGFPGLNEENGRQVFDLPLHPAADAFYRRGDPVTADKFEIGSAFLAGLLFIVSVVGYFINRYKARLLKLRKRNIVPYFEELLQYGQKMAGEDDIGRLRTLLDRMMDMQRRAEKEWLKGDLDTEHMENLYAIYGIRCDNAFNRMILLQLIENKNLLEQLHRQLQPPPHPGETAGE
jgi:TRAP transporter TAXI family solute receptor